MTDQQFILTLIALAIFVAAILILEKVFYPLFKSPFWVEYRAGVEHIKNIKCIFLCSILYNFIPCTLIISTGILLEKNFFIVFIIMLPVFLLVPVFHARYLGKKAIQHKKDNE